MSRLHKVKNSLVGNEMVHILILKLIKTIKTTRNQPVIKKTTKIGEKEIKEKMKNIESVMEKLETICLRLRKSEMKNAKKK